MDWIRMSAGFDHHPQVIQAGWHGGQLFLLMLRIARRFRLGGLLPPQYTDPGFLLGYWGAPPDFPMEEALQRLTKAGLVKRQLDGSLEIDGWERWATTEESGASTERVRRFRQRKRFSNAETVEERRGEEKRREEASDSVSDLQRLWNEVAGAAGLPQWKETGTTREKRVLAALSARRIDGPDGWREVVSKIAGSAFCRGATPRGDWRASPDWLIQSDTAAKVLEGKYDDRKPAAAKADTGRPTEKPITEEEVDALLAGS
jgi:hypothetical protein